jgi:hypothetical protein
LQPAPACDRKTCWADGLRITRPHEWGYYERGGQIWSVKRCGSGKVCDHRHDPRLRRHRFGTEPIPVRQSMERACPRRSL